MYIDLDKYLGTHSQGYVIKTLEFDDNKPIINTIVAGYASVKPEQREMKEDFLFDVASLTKYVTAILVYKAIEENLLSFETKVSAIEPKFTKLDDITIQDLLAHRQEIWTEGYLGDCQTKEDFYNIIHTAYVKETDRKYMDVDYIILSMLLEKVYNKNLSEILNEKIIKPLNLKNTTYNPEDTTKIVSNNYDYVTKFFGMNKEDILDFIYPGVPHDNKANIAKNLGIYLGHAGIFTTAEDFLKILSTLIDDSYLLLNKETINKMLEHDDTEGLNRIKLIKCGVKNVSDINELFNEAKQLTGQTKGDFSPYLSSYNYSGTRYRNTIDELNDIPKRASQNSITFSGYTGPIFLIDFDKKIIVLVMSNVCHESKTDRHTRKDTSVRLVEEIYNKVVGE